MIQEKDFLYRVPVKTAPITTPGGQIRNPEILVDLEGGEFMHGNILDANSTNKLVNQSVKEAVDNKLNESGYVTKDLLEAETTRATEQENSLKTLIGAETIARTKGDEDLGSKIKAEQTRAEGKEKEISDKLAIVNGDSNTEGSFRKAIADVIAAAPEDLDTLKEIADKLAGNDDLHTALNQAITEKADASALANEVSRATGAESGLQAAIATKADATALSNYVLTTALNKQVDTLNTAISAKADRSDLLTLEKKVTANAAALERKQPKGDYVRYSSQSDNGYFFHDRFTSSEPFVVDDSYGNDVEYGINGIVASEYQNCLATSDGAFKPISDFASAEDVSSLRVGLSKKQNKITVNIVDITDIETADVTKLRTIVTNLINALISSGLINATTGVE